jgi:signal transduction histidine kinase
VIDVPDEEDPIMRTEFAPAFVDPDGVGRAVAAERRRIAAELHDVVTHGVTVMMIQAEAARRLLATDPRAAEQALVGMHDAGTQTMRELRAMLASPPCGVPGPIDGVVALVRRVHRAGLGVRLQVLGRPGLVGPAAGRAAYRVVQEALTNVLRHAGSEVAVTVRISWSADLRIEVTNTPPDASWDAGAAPSGLGLRSLHRRVVLAGGRFQAGATADGGWRVAAVLPYEDPAVRGDGEAQEGDGGTERHALLTAAGTARCIRDGAA